MSLANCDFGDLGDKIAEGVDKELPLVDELREEVRKLQVKKLGSRPCHSIAPVATDGGENRLSFEPLNLEIIRVVDSNGTDLVQEVVPLSAGESVFERYVDRIAALNRLLEVMGGVAFDELSFLVGHKTSRGEQYEQRETNIRGQLRAFRDIVEWAVVMDLASRDWPTDVLLLRDGLLRSKIFKLSTFPLLDKAFQSVFESQGMSRKHRVYLLGVAKTSAVLSKLSLAMMLEKTFNKDFPCYAEVPKDLEAKCYNFDRTWLETAEDRAEGSAERYQSFGRMHLVKLSPMRTAPILPVDIPVWLPTQDRQMVLEYLAYDAQHSFPVIGYPHSLQKAHDHVTMTGLEMTVLGDIMIHRLLEHFDEGTRERILRLVNLGRGLLKGGVRHGG